MARSTVEQIAAELSRLDPAGCGEDSGYRAYEGDSESWPSVGYYYNGGNGGHAVISVHPEDIAAALAVLRGYEDGQANARGPDSFAYDPEKKMSEAGVRCKWH